MVPGYHPAAASATPPRAGAAALAASVAPAASAQPLAATPTLSGMSPRSGLAVSAQSGAHSGAQSSAQSGGRRARCPFGAAEVRALRHGVARYTARCAHVQGSKFWQHILDDAQLGHVFARPDGGRRTAQDLKDKWATLMREETRGGPSDAPSF